MVSTEYQEERDNSGRLKCIITTAIEERTAQTVIEELLCAAVVVV